MYACVCPAGDKLVCAQSRVLTMPPLDFSTEALPASAPDWCRKLLYQARDTGVVIEGDHIAAQRKLGQFYLVVSEYDYLDGVACRFNLISADFKLLDVVSPPDYRGLVEPIRHAQRTV